MTQFRYHTYILSILLLLIMSPLSAQTTQKLSANKSNEYGLIYSLPLTAIDVTVEAEKTIETPGEFSLYAKKYLQIAPVTEASTRWALKKVVITPRGVADPDEKWLVQFKVGSVPYIVINDLSFPLSINTEEAFAVPAPATITPQPLSVSILEQPIAQQAMTEEMLRSTSVAKRAELAAARIVELRQNRSDVISGQADAMPTDGEAMKLALSRMDEQEKALTAMFAGTVQTATEVETFSFTPDSLGARQSFVLARLSPTRGIVDADDLSGAPICLEIDVTRRGKLPVNEKGETKRFPKGGLAYRIPGQARVWVQFGGETLAETTMPLAQAGVVFGLDPNLFTDKKAPAKAVFNPLTGAIVELSTVAP